MSQLRRFRSLYGAGPLHLLALLASFAIAGAAVVGWFQRPRDVGNVLVWFVAAIVIHDLVLLPLYSLLDRIAFGLRRERVDGAQRATVFRLVDPAAYVRIPAILSGLLLIVFFPVIFRLGDATQRAASGFGQSVYLSRWLLVSGVMFALSGLAYAVAVARAGAHAQVGDPAPETTGPGPDEVAPDPDSAASEPELGAPEPDPIAPQPDQTAPGPDQTAPGPDHAAPGPDHAAPGDAAPSQPPAPD